MADATKFIRMAEMVKQLRYEKQLESNKNKRLLKEIERLEKIIKALTL